MHPKTRGNKHFHVEQREKENEKEIIVAQKLSQNTENVFF
jgi:hypothetical protein